MKSIRELFKNKDFLFDEPEVEELYKYAEQLEDEIIDYKYDIQKLKNRDVAMLVIIKEIVDGCTEIEKKQEESIRFGYEAPDFQEAISNLKKYIYQRCKDEKIYL